MKNLLYTFALTGIIGTSWGQQIPMYNQINYTPFVYNPALAGSDGISKLFLFHKTQWTGLQGAPQTTALNFEGALQENKAGLGFSVFNDRTNILNQSGGYGAYSYRLKINNDHSVLLGAAVGVMNTRIDYDKVIVKDQNDQSLFSQSQSKATFDANVGLAYNWRALQIGFSVPQVFNPRLNLMNDNTISTKYGLSRQFIATAKYTFLVLQDKSLSITPLGMARITPNTPVQYEFNLITTYKDMIGLSVAYKSNYSIATSLMFRLHHKLTVGYSYDIIINDLVSYARTSHEIVLGYNFGSSKRLAELETRLNETQSKLSQTDSLVNKHENEIAELKKKSEESATATKAIQDSLTNLAKDVEEIKSRNLIGVPNQMYSSNSGINTIDVRYGNAEDYEDENGNTLKPGGYVVVGVFGEKAYAKRFQKKLNSSVLILNKKIAMHYVFIASDEDFTTLSEELSMARKNIDPLAWILKIK